MLAFLSGNTAHITANFQKSWSTYILFFKKKILSFSGVMATFMCLLDGVKGYTDHRQRNFYVATCEGGYRRDQPVGKDANCLWPCRLTPTNTLRILIDKWWGKNQLTHPLILGRIICFLSLEVGAPGSRAQKWIPPIAVSLVLRPSRRYQQRLPLLL